MRQFRQIDVRAIDLETLGVQIAYVMTDSPSHKDACRRNACLIAAAEEVLETLIGMTEATERWNTAVEQIIGKQPDSGIDVSRARAVIAKATGAQP